MTAMEIRCATTGDRDVVLALLRTQLREHRIATPDDAIASALDGLLQHPQRGAVLVATIDGDVVGVAVLSTTWTVEHGGAAVWLEELYVDPGHRDRGIGRALLAATYATAREYGAGTVDLEVDVDHDRAAHLYAREGFERLPRTRWVRRLR